MAHQYSSCERITWKGQLSYCPPNNNLYSHVVGPVIFRVRLQLRDSTQAWNVQDAMFFSVGIDGHHFIRLQDLDVLQHIGVIPFHSVQLHVTPEYIEWKIQCPYATPDYPILIQKPNIGAAIDCQVVWNKSAKFYIESVVCSIDERHIISSKQIPPLHLSRFDTYAGLKLEYHSVSCPRKPYLEFENKLRHQAQYKGMVWIIPKGILHSITVLQNDENVDLQQWSNHKYQAFGTMFIQKPFKLETIITTNPSPEINQLDHYTCIMVKLGIFSPITPSVKNSPGLSECIHRDNLSIDPDDDIYASHEDKNHHLNVLTCLMKTFNHAAFFN